MGDWGIGALGHWGIGALGYWGIGRLGDWFTQCPSAPEPHLPFLDISHLPDKIQNSMQLQPPKLKKAVLTQLEKILGTGSFSFKDIDRFNYSRDSNFKSTIRIKNNKLEPLPDIIVWPNTVEELQQIVKVAIRHKIPLIPFGGGSGVCGGTIAERGGIIVDMKKIRRLIKVDASNLLAVVEGGMMGLHLERELQSRGYTLGHFPSSILCASFGGYLAARSAGQNSSRYGKIEDMVSDLEVVTGCGEIIQTRDIANGGGIDLNEIFLGSEGTLGFITKATVRIHPLAPCRNFRGIRFRNMHTAFEAIRRLMQTGLKPSVIRLYDELDTLIFLSGKSEKDVGSFLPDFATPLINFLKSSSLKGVLNIPRLIQPVIRKLPSGCLVVFMHEGHERIVAEEQRATLDICLDLGGKDMGEEPGQRWEKHRYSISYKSSPLFYSGAFTDTIEMATTWDKIESLYEGVVQAISPHCLVMAHLSHVYTDGGALYFTVVAPLGSLKKSEDLYDLIWDRALKVCQELGGVISHHHGIGRLKAKYMEKEWGEGVALFRAFKDLYDPHGIMNPGKLIHLKKKKKEKAA